MRKEINMIEILKKVIATLDNIEVHGKENLNRLLACIQTLENVCAEVENEADNK